MPRRKATSANPATQVKTEPQGIHGDYDCFMGKRIAVFGPSFIWIGRLTRETPRCITLDDVYQIYTTGQHDQNSPDKERICDVMVIEKNSICNVGATIWC